MQSKRMFSIASPSAELRFDVPAAVPTIFIMLGRSLLVKKADVLRDLWIHAGDPLYRIGVNWPRSEFERSFLLRELEHELSAGYDILADILSLGAAAHKSLSLVETTLIDQVNSPGYQFATDRTISGGGSTVTCISDRMPDDYALPFVGAGVLHFQSEPVRLIGLEYLHIAAVVPPEKSIREPGQD